MRELIEKMFGLLWEMQWAGNIPCASTMQGGQPSCFLPCCPVCGGIKPSEQAEKEFIESAIGHHPLCPYYRRNDV